MRSIATRGARGEISEHLKDVIGVVRQSGFDIIFVETAGIGQGDRAITDLVDLTIYVMTSEYGAPSQLEKIEMLDYADIVVINKFTRQGSEDALRDVRKQIQRNKKLFDTPADELMVFGTSAAHFNDHGVNQLYGHVMKTVVERCGLNWQSSYAAGADRVTDTSHHIIPPQRERYLSEIAEACREYRTWARQQAEVASELDALRRAIVVLGGPNNAERTRFSDAAIKRAGVGQGDLIRVIAVILIVMGILFYVVLIRGERKQAKRMEAHRIRLRRRARASEASKSKKAHAPEGALKADDAAENGPDGG